MDIKRFVDKIKESGQSPEEIAKLFEDALNGKLEPKRPDTKDFIDPTKGVDEEENVKHSKKLSKDNKGTWKNLTKRTKSIVAGSIAVGLVSAITFPVLSFTVWRKGVDPVSPIADTFSLSETSVTLTEGKQHKIIAKGVPAGTTVEWLSTKPDIVSVDSNGILTAPYPSEEKVKIIATAGDKSALCTINGVNINILDFATCSWSEIAEKCTKYEKGIYTESQFIKSFTYNAEPITSLSDFVGKERLVYLTNPDGTKQKNPHRTRVIGTNHDTLSSDNTKKAVLTFEFANLISDNDGYSIGLLWNDMAGDYNVNLDYPNSSLRKALYRNGNYSGDVLYTQKEQSKFSEDYTNKTIFSMLPSDLQMAIKPVKKSVGTTNQYTETFYDDELFLLSSNEIGYKGSFGSAYEYYQDLPLYEVNPKRIKCQVKTNAEHWPGQYVKIPAGSGQAYSGTCYNSAGYVNEGGCLYHLVAPTGDTCSSLICDYSGKVADYGFVNKHCYGVAPGFCI